MKRLALAAIVVLSVVACSKKDEVPADTSMAAPAMAPTPAPAATDTSMMTDTTKAMDTTMTPPPAQ